jgi:molecular chaperone DnaK
LENSTYLIFHQRLRGVPQIEVTFDIDANGILNVSAKDKGTGKEQKIRIEASSGLSDEEIQRMKSEAEANAAADQEAKERIDKINQADGLVFQTEKQIKEYGDKIPADKKEAIETAKADLKKAVEAQDLAAIDAGTEALNKAWEAASQDLYNAQQAAGGEGTGDAGDASSSSEGGSTDDVEDVDFEEVK